MGRPGVDAPALQIHRQAGLAPHVEGPGIAADRLDGEGMTGTRSVCSLHFVRWQLVLVEILGDVRQPRQADDPQTGTVSEGDQAAQLVDLPGQAVDLRTQVRTTGPDVGQQIG